MFDVILMLEQGVLAIWQDMIWAFVFEFINRLHFNYGHLPHLHLASADHASRVSVEALNANHMLTSAADKCIKFGLNNAPTCWTRCERLNILNILVFGGILNILRVDVDRVVNFNFSFFIQFNEKFFIFNRVLVNFP